MIDKLITDLKFFIFTLLEACLTFKIDEMFGFRPGRIIGAYTCLSTRPYSTLVVCEDDMFLIY